jgi:putative hydrolase
VVDRVLNSQAAEIFRECAEILRHQSANPFRVNAYVRAANVLESLQGDVRDLLVKEGVDGLVKLPGIGKGLAAAIDEIARTGRLAQLDRLRDFRLCPVSDQDWHATSMTDCTSIHSRRWKLQPTMARC